MLTEELIPAEETEKTEPIAVQEPVTRSYTDYHNAKYDIISIVAYLVGVEKRHFENEHEPPKMEHYERLEKDKNARIIRNLCRIRTAFERQARDINTAFRYDLKNIGTIPHLIPVDAVDQLWKDGISLQKSRPEIDTYLIAINKELSNRIGNCKALFPDWLCWDYVKPLFLMPNGMKPQGLKAAHDEYIKDRNRYPYQCYMNWQGETNGNILHSDEKFVRLLYEAHEDYFRDLSLVQDVGNIVLDNIATFLDQSEKAIMVVDCENSDPTKLAAALSSLSKNGLSKILKILLVDSDYTTTGWQVLRTLAPFPLEHIKVPRINERKSQVDMALATRTCKEVYTNDVDSVILVSSDSDYWALIQNLSDVHFLVMVEKIKCGHDIKVALNEQGIHYCYLDDFYTGASYTIKTKALVDCIQGQLDEMVNFNAKTMLNDALRSTWVSMTDKEIASFYDRYLRRMRMDIAADGTARLVLGE